MGNEESARADGSEEVGAEKEFGEHSRQRQRRERRNGKKEEECSRTVVHVYTFRWQVESP